jgi:hypothetical protein
MSKSTGLTMHSIHQTLAASARRGLFAGLAALTMLVAGAAVAAGANPKSFGSPEDAVKELVAAAKSGDTKAMLAVLGAAAKGLVSSGDAVADRAAYERFVKAYEEGHKIEKQGDTKAVLSVGKDDWPLPIPLVKSDAGWRFDAKQGQEEILNRRIGRNELSAMRAVQAYVDAQREYYVRNPGGDKLLHYAQKLVSAKGKRDGLYFPTKGGEPASPLGAFFAKAQAEGYKAGEGGKPVPYHGYYYRILKAQGPGAKGGAYDYVAQGKMIGGFALVAYPASYGNSGVVTFIVNHEGIVYQKDLGPQTGSIAANMRKFDPDGTWKRL